jgi:hypothetical protein
LTRERSHSSASVDDRHVTLQKGFSIPIELGLERAELPRSRRHVLGAQFEQAIGLAEADEKHILCDLGEPEGECFLNRQDHGKPGSRSELRSHDARNSQTSTLDCQSNSV